jgi:hypothetical protein
MKECGPIFGGFKNLPTYTDIYIANNANLNEFSRSYLGFTYKHTHFNRASKEAITFLAGSNTFQLNEMEVYKKNGSK